MRCCGRTGLFSIMEFPSSIAIEKIKKMPRAAFYVCHGEYEFLNKEFAAALARVLYPDEAERGEAVQKFDWDEGEKAIDSWAEAARSPSLFGGDQLLIVDNAQAPSLNRRENPPTGAKDPDKFTNWGAYSRFERAIEGPIDGVSTLFICNEALKSTVLLKGRRSDKFVQRIYPLINEKGIVVAFPRLYDDKFPDWLAGRARVQGLHMDTDTAEFFAVWAGTDMRHLANEIEKMVTCLGEGATVTQKDVRNLVTSSNDQYIYQVFDAAMEGKGNEAIRLLNMSLEGSAQPLQIVASLGGVMRDMWQARWLMDKGYFKKVGSYYSRAKMEEEIGRVTPADRDALSASGGGLVGGRQYYKAYMALRRAKLIQLHSIENIMQRLMDIDCWFKGMRLPKRGSDEIVLEQLMADLSYTAKRGAAPSRRGRS